MTDVEAAMAALIDAHNTDFHPGRRCLDAKAAKTGLIAQAQNQCDSTKSGTTIADGGRTLTIDSQGSEDFTGLGLTNLDCVLTALQVPEAVKQHIQSTRALDGRQEDSWDGFTASWSYHPDDGLDAIVQAK